MLTRRGRVAKNKATPATATRAVAAVNPTSTQSRTTLFGMKASLWKLLKKSASNCHRLSVWRVTLPVVVLT